MIFDIEIFERYEIYCLFFKNVFWIEIKIMVEVCM